MKGAVRCASQHQHKTTCCSAERKDNWLTWPFRPLSCRSTARSCQGYACYPDVRRRACLLTAMAWRVVLRGRECTRRVNVNVGVTFHSDVAWTAISSSTHVFVSPFFLSLFICDTISPETIDIWMGAFYRTLMGAESSLKLGYISGRSMSLVGLKGIVSTESGGRTGDGTDMYSFP